MGSFLVDDREHVELEVPDVVDGRLVIDEELAEQSQVGAVHPWEVVEYYNKYLLVPIEQ